MGKLEGIEEDLKEETETIEEGMEQIVAGKVRNAFANKDAKTNRLREELTNAIGKLRILRKSKFSDEKADERSYNRSYILPCR